MFRVMIFILGLLYAATPAWAEKGDSLACGEDASGKVFCKAGNGRPFSGKSSSYYDGGRLKSTEYFTNGLRNGAMITFDEEGHRKERLYYDHGIKNGSSKVYYENRTVKYMMNYHKGLLDGRVDIYSDEGKIRGRLYYREGFLKKGFCQNGSEKQQLTYQQISAQPFNELYTCGVQ